MGLVEEARNIILSVEYDEAEICESKNIEMWERLNNKIEAGQDKRHFLKAEVQEQKNKSFKGNFNYAILYRYRAAAVFIGVLLLSVAYYFAAGVNTYKEYATNYGEIKTIMLPDSSQVTLNANSNLSFNTGRSTNNPREVWIEGEAFFTVRKKPHAGQC